MQYSAIRYNTIQYNTIQYNTIQYITIQCNTIQYNTIHTSNAMLSSGIPWNMPRVTCIFRMASVYTKKIQVTSGMFPCLNLWKTYGNVGKSSEISANFLKFRERFKPILEELKPFMKLLENFGNSSKVFSRCFFMIF